MLKIKNLIKKYGNTNVINGFSMSIGETGIYAIMGASGIGKTTLLNIIARLEAPTSGEVFNTFKKVSFKFQEPRLLNWLTAKQNVESVLSENKKKLALKLLCDVGMNEDMDKYPDELSGGMQQRVALARALAYDGDLLLLDEPFGAVDAETKEHLIQLVKEYSNEHAVIIVTHDINEATELNAKILNMS